MTFDPGATQVAVEEGAAALEKAADTLYEATVKAGKAERAYERARLTALAKLQAEYKEAKERLPGEDIRHALVFPRLSPEWDEWFVARYELAALEKSAQALRAAISARQSLLRATTGGI